MKLIEFNDLKWDKDKGIMAVITVKIDSTEFKQLLTLLDEGKEFMLAY